MEQLPKEAWFGMGLRDFGALGVRALLFRVLRSVLRQQQPLVVVWLSGGGGEEEEGTRRLSALSVGTRLSVIISVVSCVSPIVLTNSSHNEPVCCYTVLPGIEARAGRCAGRALQNSSSDAGQ